MRRLAVLLAVAATAVPLLPGLAPSTGAASEVRHYLNADQIGTPGDDWLSDISVAGNVVASSGTVAGSLPGKTSGGGEDAFIRATDGELGALWTIQAGGSGADRGTAVATDGELVVAGGTTAGGIGTPALGGQDGWVMLVESDGDVLWTELLGGPGWDGVADVAIVGDEIYAVGWIDEEGTVWKLDSTGAIEWTAVLTPHDPDSHTSTSATRIQVLDDQVVVAENFYYEDDDGTRTLSLDAATGGENWASSVSHGFTTAITTDGEQIYVTRNTENFSTYRNIGVLTARSLDGTFQWSTALYPTQDFDFRSRGAVWDGSAIVTVSGTDLIAFSPAGRRRWTMALPPGLDPAAAAFGATDYAARGVYVGGSTTRALGGPKQGGRDAVVGRFVLYQPDARVRTGGEVLGDDRYAKPGQRLTVPVPRGRSRSVALTAQSDGEVVQPLRLRGCGAHDGYDVRYRSGSTDLTRAMTGPRGYRANAIAPGGVSLVEVTIHARRRAAARSTCGLVVSSIVSGERDRFTLVLTGP